MPDKSLPADSPETAGLKSRLAGDSAPRRFVELARKYHEEGQLEEAARVCARGLKQHPSYVSARVLLGRIYFDMGRTEEACAEMESVLAEAPDNLIARRVLAEISLERGDLGGALDRFRALLAFNPTDTETRKRIDEIEAMLRAPARPPEPSSPLLETEPSVPKSEPGGTTLDPGVLATPTLAEIYVQQGLTDQAAQVYREILKGDPSDGEALARLSEIERISPPPDPRAQARRRKIATLSSWLQAIRGAGHV